MKKILIVSDGETGRNFIERVIETQTTENIYYIVQTKAETSFVGYNPGGFKFFNFDPTSFYKLSNILKMDLHQVVLVLENVQDLENTIKNIRMYKPSMRIIALDFWNSKRFDDGVEWINVQENLALNLINYLPNIPVLAQNIGLGTGEIMEVLVPFGSSFVYRHVGAIEQNNWKIVAIYRNRELIIPNDQKMIQPNDSLVLVGEPSVLKTVYRAIKRELGQFPAPFGSKLYLYLDMAIENRRSIQALLRRSLYIHQKLNKPLLIKVVNPGDLEILREIKSKAATGVHVEIVYDLSVSEDMILNDINVHHIGLFIVSQRVFKDKKMRRKLYIGNVPVLKLADKSFSMLKQVSIVLGEESHVENISTTIFDVAAQFGFDLELINYMGEDPTNKGEVIEHFQNLSTIFSKTIRIVNQEQNPIRYLREKENFLQCLPFTDKMFHGTVNKVLMTDPEALYGKLDRYHQLFIPTQI